GRERHEPRRVPPPERGLRRPLDPRRQGLRYVAAALLQPRSDRRARRRPGGRERKDPAVLRGDPPEVPLPTTERGSVALLSAHARQRPAFHARRDRWQPPA